MLKKRIICTALLLTMVLSLMPLMDGADMIASAATVHDVNDSTELTAALAIVDDGDTINITDSFSHNETVFLSGVSIDLVLNDHTVTIENTPGDVISNGIAIRLGEAIAPPSEPATLNVIGPGTLIAKGNPVSEIGNAINVLNGSILSIDDTAADKAEIIAESAAGFAVFVQGENSTATVTSTTGTVSVQSNGTLTVNGNVLGGVNVILHSTLTVGGNVNGGVFTSQGSKVTINGNVTSTSIGVVVTVQDKNYFDPVSSEVTINGTLTASSTFIRFGGGQSRRQDRTPTQYDAVVTRNGNTYRQYKAPLEFNGSVFVRELQVPPPVSPFKDITHAILPQQSIDAINWAHANGIFNGWDGEFRPFDTLTRACFALILWRLEGSPEPKYTSPGFDDIVPGVHYKAILWCQENGILNGFGDGTVRPTHPLPRYQIVTMMYRYHTLIKHRHAEINSNALDRFPDRNDFPLIDRVPMQWAVTIGMIRGMEDGRIYPNTVTNREMGAMVLFRYTNQFNKP